MGGCWLETARLNLLYVALLALSSSCSFKFPFLPRMTLSVVFAMAAKFLNFQD